MTDTSQPERQSGPRPKLAAWFVRVCGAILGGAAVMASLSGSAVYGASSASTTLPASSAAPGSAATSTTPNVVTFGVQPAGLKGPDRRGFFSFSTTPGARFVDRAAVRNYSYHPLVLTLRASDATNTSQGNFALVPSTQRSKDVGTWIDIPASERTLTVPPRGFRVITFNLSVPRGATPGDHAGGIVVTLQSFATSKTGQRFKLLQSVGSRMFVRVSGPLHPGFTIRGLTVNYQASLNPIGRGRAVVSYTVANTGNVALGGRQTVSVTGLFGSKTYAKAVPQVQLLLPGNSVKETVRFGRVFPELRMTAHVSISPLVVPDSVEPPSGPYRATVTFWAIPWVLVAIVLLIVIGAAAWCIRRRGRWPARKEFSKPTGPTAGPPPGRSKTPAQRN